MHPALQLEELRFLISRSDALSCSDLCRLALVSKDWRDVAEPVLWEDLPDIVYLFMLMPRDSWSISRSPTDSSIWGFRFTKALTRNLWQPLLRKSGYVKRLSVRAMTYASVTPLSECPPPSGFLHLVEVLRVINTPSPSSAMPGVECNFLAPILPTARIRTLLFYRSAISELYHMGHTFLSSFSSITKLHIRADLQETQGRDEDFLQTLQSLSPQLSGGLALLCVFREPLMYLPLFSRLSQILNIITLHISFAYPFLPDDPHRASYTAPTFPSLQNLRLFNCSVDFVVDVLRASPAHQLRLVRVSLDPFDPVTDIAPLVQAIYERCDRERLRVLVIKSVRLPGNVEKEMEHLRPLRVFKKLTTSYFDCARLSSADLEADVIPGCTAVTTMT